MSTTPICNGCGGRGWVDSMYYGAMKCPLCNGRGTLTFTAESTYEKDVKT